MFLFPFIYLNKKAIIVTPTISLMHHQVHKCNDIQVSSVFLGSAQFYKLAEVRAFTQTVKNS